MAVESALKRLEREFGHERLEVFHDARTGLRGAVALHSTQLGPAMGGVRLMSYPEIWSLVEDALRLSRAMTFKNAVAGLALGGGKAVLFDDGLWGERRAERFAAFGHVIEGLNGSYVAAEDVGTTPADMNAVAEVTQWVAGRSVEAGGRGDPSSATAKTVTGAIRSAVRAVLGSSLSGVRVGVLGVGSVGSQVAWTLAADGADLLVADVNTERANAIAAECGGASVAVDGFLARELDVLAPCALGKVVTRSSVGSLNCRIVAGAANNQLEDDALAQALAAAGIFYVPDFLANSGGIIHVGAEVLGLPEAGVRQLIVRSIDRTDRVVRHAVARQKIPLDEAYQLAEVRLAGAPAEAVAA